MVRLPWKLHFWSNRNDQHLIVAVGRHQHSTNCRQANALDGTRSKVKVTSRSSHLHSDTLMQTKSPDKFVIQYLVKYMILNIWTWYTKSGIIHLCINKHIWQKKKHILHVHSHKAWKLLKKILPYALYNYNKPYVVPGIYKGKLHNRKEMRKEKEMPQTLYLIKCVVGCCCCAWCACFIEVHFNIVII